MICIADKTFRTEIAARAFVAGFSPAHRVSVTTVTEPRRGTWRTVYVARVFRAL